MAPSSSDQDGPSPEPRYDQGTSAFLSLRDRIMSTFGRGGGGGTGAPPPDPSTLRPMTDAEKRDWIRGLEPLERKLGYLAAAYVAIFVVAWTLPHSISPYYVHLTGSVCGDHHKSCTKNYEGYEQLFLAIEAILVAALAGAAYFKKRSLLAFLSLMGAFALSTGNSVLFGLPILVYAGWLFMRSWRVQRYGSPNAKVAAAQAAEQRRTGVKPPGAFSIFRRRPAAASTAVSTPRSASSSGGGAGGSRSVPEASKRYTPKKAKPVEAKSRYKDAKASAAKAKSGAAKAKTGAAKPAGSKAGRSKAGS